MTLKLFLWSIAILGSFAAQMRGSQANVPDPPSIHSWHRLEQAYSSAVRDAVQQQVSVAMQAHGGVANVRAGAAVHHVFDTKALNDLFGLLDSRFSEIETYARALASGQGWVFDEMVRQADMPAVRLIGLAGLWKLDRRLALIASVRVALTGSATGADPAVLVAREVLGASNDFELIANEFVSNLQRNDGVNYALSLSAAGMLREEAIDVLLGHVDPANVPSLSATTRAVLAVIGFDYYHRVGRHVPEQLYTLAGSLIELPGLPRLVAIAFGQTQVPNAVLSAALEYEPSIAEREVYQVLLGEVVNRYRADIRAVLKSGASRIPPERRTYLADLLGPDD